MSGRVLTANVWVEDRLYTVGMTRGVGVPEDVAVKIGDHAWSQPAEDTDSAAGGGVSAEEPGAGPGAGSDTDSDGNAAVDGPVTGEHAPSVEPPRAGRGSSREAWAAYAATVGVTVGADDTRDDIIAAVDAATA